MTSLIEGHKYEKYVKSFLQNKYKNIWLWNETPINILHALNIIPISQTSCDDIGCDIIAETNDNIFHFIQCKNYSTLGIDNTINICDLAGFYNFLAENNFTTGIVYYSGCLSSQVLKRAKLVKYINLPYTLAQNIQLTPFSYQIDAVNKLSQRGRNVLTMPCGTGKTYVSYLLSAKYKNIIILSPLISTAEQLFTFYKQYYQNSNTCNICVFNCMNKSKIIDNTKNNVIISTYDSVTLIYNSVRKLEDKIIIIDEYHNLSQTNLDNQVDDINKLLSFVDASYLFMSATPHKKLSSYINIFGNNSYNLNWSDAINNKYICDYKFYYPNPEIVDNKITELKTHSALKKIDINKCILLNKAYYLLECIKELGLRKIIVFLKTISESNEFQRILNIINLFFENKLSIGEINYNTSKSVRNKTLTRFRNKSETINILCNVHILDEGIDIPECDAVYLTHPNNNPINFIQRISRCNRLKPGNVNNSNIANVLIWAKDEKKKLKIDELISAYLTISENIITNNIYIRGCNNSKNNKVILEDINQNINSNSVISSNIINNKLITCDELFEHIHKTENIPLDFIKEYFEFYKLCKDNKFGIPVEKVVIYLDLKKQERLETRIRSIYKLNNEYIIIREQKKSIKCVKNARYMISFDTYNKICISSNTKKGSECKVNFLKLYGYING